MKKEVPTAAANIKESQERNKNKRKQQYRQQKELIIKKPEQSSQKSSCLDKVHKELVDSSTT